MQIQGGLLIYRVALTRGFTVYVSHHGCVSYKCVRRNGRSTDRQGHCGRGAIPRTRLASLVSHRPISPMGTATVESISTRPQPQRVDTVASSTFLELGRPYHLIAPRRELPPGPPFGTLTDTSSLRASPTGAIWLLCLLYLSHFHFDSN